MASKAGDASDVEVLSREECLQLIGTAPVGRIAFTDRALPAIQPVSFLMDRGDVVIRTAADSVLAGATRNAIVAFQVDRFDNSAGGRGWSVTAIGHARSVLDPDEIARLRRLPLQSWTPGRGDHFIRVYLEYVTGRRISPR